MQPAGAGIGIERQEEELLDTRTKVPRLGRRAAVLSETGGRTGPSLRAALPKKGLVQIRLPPVARHRRLVRVGSSRGGHLTFPWGEVRAPCKPHLLSGKHMGDLTHHEGCGSGTSPFTDIAPDKMLGVSS